ncbi:alpha-amylase family glycosyl hydrolase [Orenia marismortui]|uniref:alpha-amylase family glycosyl hydrolase n=1 Tax=Orenia marismortui TaxID=46469 RepID=UPI000370BC4E|nr:alpha-amylase family glycosyl hydrolase [Orenia marismortui]
MNRLIKRKFLFLIAIIAIVSLIVGCSSDGNKGSKGIGKLNVAINIPTELLQTITDDVKLEGGKVFITATNQDDPNDKHQQDTAVAEEISFEFSEVTEGASYDIKVIAKDEDGYAAYRGEASATIAAAKNTLIEMELKLTAAEALSVELENLPAGNLGEVVLASATSEAIKADIDFENSIANFEQGIAANHYPLMVKIDGEIVKKGKLVLYPGRSTVVTVDMSASGIDLGDLPIKWEEPRNDFEAPVVTSSKEPKRYLNPIELTLDIEDNKDPEPKLYYTTDGSEPLEDPDYLYTGEKIKIDESMRISTLAVDNVGNRREVQFRYYIGAGTDRTDFRKETIYFLMTSRFYDGDPANNIVCWDEESYLNNPPSDPAWRGDFQGLIEKLDYIKALGFSAIWITPVVKNYSGLDYHGYHAGDFTEVDPRYESPGATYEDLVDAVHDKGMKIIQDVVFNHTSNMGEENLYPLFKKDNSGDYIYNDNDPNSLEANELLNTVAKEVYGKDYANLVPDLQYKARIAAMKEDNYDTEYIYHHEKNLEWEGYTVQTGQIAGDCVDLNTENPKVSKYLREAYYGYIDMGVDGFRVDTVKHISRLTLNNEFIPYFKERGGEEFFMFGEVASIYSGIWNHDNPNISVPFYTWKEEKSYPWGDTETNMSSTKQFWEDNKTLDNVSTSENHLLDGNQYHQPDWSMRSGLDQIDFTLHHNFIDASTAFNNLKDDDKFYNDSTWNVTYVDSHDYGPNGSLNERFNQSQATWAENLSLMFTWRGIPTIYYGSEIEFKKGESIDPATNRDIFEESGRAYYGDNIEGSVTASDFGEYTASGTVADTLDHPLAQHIRRLNQIRRAVPALQMGQYSTEGIDGNLAFKRRYTNDNEAIDSFVLVTISNGATFNGIPNGTYTDVVTGNSINVTNGTLTANVSDKGNARIYVLDGSGKIGEDGEYLH